MKVAARAGQVLRGLVRVSSARPVVTVLVCLVLAAASVLYALRDLNFLTSTRALLPRALPVNERYDEYQRDFGALDEIVVAVEGRNLPVTKAFASRLVGELRHHPGSFRRISYRIDPKQFAGRALLYLSVEKLAEIRDRIFDNQEFMEGFAARPTLDQFVEGINTQVASAFVTSFFDVGLEERDEPVNLRFLRDLLTQISARVDRPAPYRSPWGSLFTVDTPAEDAGYFLSDDESLLFIMVEAVSEKGSFTGDRDAIELLRATIARVRQEFPDVEVGVTGDPALSNDEMVAAFHDSETATMLAFAMTLGILVIAFLRVGMPILMLATLAVSLCWAVGITTLTVGHLSLFSVFFISIVIGIGIDYGIYFLFRHDEEMFLGRGVREATLITGARSGPGMLMGALTAAGTFYVLMLTDFRGIQELGFIAGTAILLSWVAMMTLFPALIILLDRRHHLRPHESIPRAIQLERIRVPFIDRVIRYPKTVLGAAGAATALSLLALPHVHFDYNLLNLQARGTESVVWEMRVLERAGRSGFTGLSSADSLEELRGKVAALQKLDTVSTVDSALLLIPSNQEAKRKIIRDFAPIVAPVRVGAPEAVDLDRLRTALETLKRRFDIAAGEAPAGRDRDEVVAVRDQTTSLLGKLARADRDAAEASLSHLQDELYRDFASKFHGLQRNLRPRPVGPADVPAELRRKFVSDSGRFLIHVHPRVNTWDRAGAERFVSELRSVDPEVTGSSIITFEAIRLMERGYRQATLYAFLLVALLSWLIIRRVREALLALLPLAVGTLWTVGLMYVFRLPFNLANVFGLPLILGAAAEFGLNVVLRYLEGREHGGPLVARSTVLAVLFSGLTTIVGFGSLMIADHRGIFGLGLLLTLGATATLVASLVVLPVALRWVAPPPRREPAPADEPSLAPTSS